MAGMVTAFYDRLDVARCYGSLEEALGEKSHREDRLEQELNTLRDVGT